MYNFNWRPDDDVAVPSSLSISPQNSRAHGHASKRFRVTLDSPYEVQSFSKDAFNCTISDVFCAIERSVEHPGMATESSWILQFHPSRAQLSPNAVLDLAKCLFSSIYVAMSVNELGYITLKYENAATLSSSSKAALNVLAIPLEALEQGVSLSASHIMQLFPLASPRLVAPAFPYLPTMTLVGHKPVAHPYRPPSLGRPSVLYSRYIHALGRHVRIESLSSTASSVDLVIDASATSAATRAGASDQGLQATIAWTLESGTPFARDIDDYDRSETNLPFSDATRTVNDYANFVLRSHQPLLSRVPRPWLAIYCTRIFKLCCISVFSKTRGQGRYGSKRTRRRSSLLCETSASVILRPINRKRSSRSIAALRSAQTTGLRSSSYEQDHSFHQAIH